MLLLHRLLEQSKALDKQGCVGVWDQLASYPNLTCSFSMLSESPPVLSFLAAVALATLASAMQVLLICCFFGLSTVLPHANECSTPNTKAAGRRVMNRHEHLQLYLRRTLRGYDWTLLAPTHFLSLGQPTDFGTGVEKVSMAKTHLFKLL